MTLLRTSQLIAALQWRRLQNRMRFGFRKKNVEERSGTARKSGGGFLLMSFLAVIFVFQSLILTSDFLKEVSFVIGPLRDDQGRIQVSASSYRKIEALDSRRMDGAEENTTAGFEVLEGQGLSFKRRSEWQALLQRQYGERGVGGFVAVPQASGDYSLPVLLAWKHPEGRLILMKVIGVLLFVLAVMRFCMALGTAQSLGKVEWDTEWLFTLPVPARDLFCAQILGHALVDPLSWVLTLPLLFTVSSSAGFGPWSLPAALLGTVYIGLAVAALCVSTETLLRKKLSPSRLKNLQALFSILAAGMYVCLYVLMRESGPVRGFVEFVKKCPLVIALNPLSLPSWVCATGFSPVFLLEVAGAVAFVWIGSGYCMKLVRNGLVAVPNDYNGKRGGATRVAQDGYPLFPGGVIGKELRLLTRDRNVFVQTFVVPLLICGLQLVTGGGALAGAVSSNFQAASALSFGLGAFVLLGAMKVLVSEGNALWMLYAAPVSISRILLQKTLMWACLGLVYTAVALCVCGAMVGSLAPVDLVYAMMACAGVFIYAFIGAGIGILGSDPLETEVQRRIKGSSVYLFMILSGMYGYALYAPSMWTRIGQLVLSSLLALALWQKVRDRQPFLLDPVSSPAPQISLADGLIAALAFFVVQGVASIIAEHFQFEKGAALSIGFFTAGASVAFFVVLLKRSTPSFFKAQDPVQGKTLGASIGIGVSAGGVAGFVGLLFLVALERMPFLQRLNDGEAPIQQIHGWWLLAVALVAAPLFEEFIFRGLVFRGMRRSFSPKLALFGSAAIFALCHPPISVVPVFVMAWIAAWSFERTGRLLTSVVLHMTYNGIVLLVPVLFFTASPLPGRGAHFKGHPGEPMREVNARKEKHAAGPLTLVQEPGKRPEMVHFSGYRGGVAEWEPSFDLWLPAKLLTEYHALVSDHERFAWLAGRFQKQLQDGDVLSGNDLGILYLYGLGVVKNWEAARGYFVEPAKRGRWVGQRYLAELHLLSSAQPEGARRAAELITPMIKAQNWYALWAALQAHDILAASESAEDRVLATQTVRPCVEGLQAGLKAPPSEAAKRRALFEMVEAVAWSLLSNPTDDDRVLAASLIEQWLAVDFLSAEARLFQLRLKIMTVRESWLFP